MKGQAFPPPTWSACSTSSIAPADRTTGAPAPAWALSICRGFIEAMDGTIIAANRTDRSRRGLHHRLPVPGQCGPAAGDHRMNAGPARILVVDDEPAILRFLRAGLSQPGLSGDRGGDRPGGAGR